MDQPTSHTDINDLLKQLQTELQRILGTRLLGLYLYGSLVTGDFDRGSSDIDVAAITATNLTQQEFEALQTMHTAIEDGYKQWEGRIEVACISVRALQTFRTQTSQIAVISPGEPFHRKEAGNDWLINWYMVRLKGLTLFGPPAESFIPPISKEDFLAAVRRQAREWRQWVYRMENRPGHAYAILTLCRALYTCTNGEQVSKKQAALWAAQTLPQWSELIQNALTWRTNWRDEQVDHAATRPDTIDFVHFMIDQCDATKPD